MSSRITLLRMATLPLSDWSALETQLNWCYSGPVSHYGRRGISGGDGCGAWLLLKGRVRVRCRATSLVVEKGSWVVFPSLAVDREFSRNARIVSVSFRARWPDGRFLFDRGLPISFLARSHPALGAQSLRLADLVKARFTPHDTTLPMAQASADEAFDLAALFHAWLGELSRALAGEGVALDRAALDDERVRRGLILVERQADARRFSKVEIARALGVSGSQLDRLFVRHVGITPHEHFERLRQAEARKLIQARTLRIKEVAAQLGFRSASQFSMWFRRGSGVSPRQFAGLARI